MKSYWERQEAIEDLEFEVVELREKNEELEGRIYELEKKCEEFDIGQRQLWESIESAAASIANLKEKYNEKNKEKKEQTETKVLAPSTPFKNRAKF